MTGTETMLFFHTLSSIVVYQWLQYYVLWLNTQADIANMATTLMFRNVL